MECRIVRLLYPTCPESPSTTRVYEALIDGQKTVLKVDISENCQVRLENEMQAMKAVSGNPAFPAFHWVHVIRSPYDRILKEGALTLCMDLAEGADLALLMARKARKGKRLSEHGAVILIRGVLRALASLHGAGWIHRDLHPGNIVISALGNVMIIDLGTAMPLSELSIGIGSDVGIRNGYQPPESVDRSMRWSKASDIYTVAASIAHARFGHHRREMLDGDSLSRWLSCCLHPDPSQRPQSCSEALLQLEGVAVRGGVAMWEATSSETPEWCARMGRVLSPGV